MNHQLTLDQLNQLKLHGMADAYQAVLSLPVQEQPSIHQFIARLTEAEAQHRLQLSGPTPNKLDQFPD